MSTFFDMLLPIKLFQPFWEPSFLNAENALDEDRLSRKSGGATGALSGGMLDVLCERRIKRQNPGGGVCVGREK